MLLSVSPIYYPLDYNLYIAKTQLTNVRLNESKYFYILYQKINIFSVWFGLQIVVKKHILFTIYSNITENSDPYTLKFLKEWMIYIRRITCYIMLCEKSFLSFIRLIFHYHATASVQLQITGNSVQQV
jgi:hypothetical protein